MKCPYDFEYEFDDWLNWQTQYICYGLTPEQIDINIKFDKQGWKLCKGFKYGCWQPKNPTKFYDLNYEKYLYYLDPTDYR